MTAAEVARARGARGVTGAAAVRCTVAAASRCATGASGCWSDAGPAVQRATCSPNYAAWDYSPAAVTALAGRRCRSALTDETILRGAGHGRGASGMPPETRAGAR
jgi:hypothetical protein